jgi:hypothetical protein
MSAGNSKPTGLIVKGGKARAAFGGGSILKLLGLNALNDYRKEIDLFLFAESFDITPCVLAERGYFC